MLGLGVRRRVGLFSIYYIAAIFSALSALYGNAFEEINQLRQQRVQEALTYSASVLVSKSNIFDPAADVGHGSAFILKLDKAEGFLLTNRHVISKDPLEAQKIILKFAPTPNGQPEYCEGEVFYSSSLYDAAVIRFDPKNLKRVLKDLRVAPIVNREEYEKLAAQGREVMAMGFPFSGDRVSTNGQITGLNQEILGFKDALLISTPINPGNSGGELIDVESGKIIAINFAKNMEADGMGYSIPLPLILEDFAKYQKDPENYGRKTFGFFRTSPIPFEHLKILGLKSTIEEIYPDFFSRFSGALSVEFAPVTSPLQAGDILLAVGETLLGSREDWLLKIAAETLDKQTFTIIRAGKIEKIDLPVKDLRKSIIRRKNNFVLISGLLLQDLTYQERADFNSGRAGVVVRKVIPGSVGDSSPIGDHDVIDEIQVGNIRKKIRSLRDVKEMIQEIRANEFINFSFYPTLRNQGKIIQSVMTRSAVHHDATAFARLPVDEVVTPDELSLKKVRKGFDFSGLKPAASNWRNYIACDKKLAAVAVAHTSGVEPK